MKNEHDLKKMTCKICWRPMKIKEAVAKLTCMCDDEIRVIPLDRWWDIEYSHLVQFGNGIQTN